MVSVSRDKEIVVQVDVQLPVESPGRVNVGPGHWFWGTVNQKWYKKDPNKVYLIWCRCGCAIECFDPDNQEKNFTVGVGEIDIISQASAKIVVTN